MTCSAPALAACTVLGLIAAMAHEGAGAQMISTRNPAQAESGHYVVEPAHTQILFDVSHMGFTDYYGRFSGASGTLDYNAARPGRSALTVTVPAASISTTSPVLTKALRGPTWFDAARYPDITFRATGGSVTGKHRGTLTGELTMHGVTRPVTLAVRFNAAGINPLDKKYTIGFSATGLLKRSDFGIDPYESMIGNTVQIIISAAFERAG